LHAHYHEVMNHHSVTLDEFSETFAKLAIAEYEPGLPAFNISIFHGSAVKLPDPLEYFSNAHPDLNVKVGVNHEKSNFIFFAFRPKFLEIKKK